MLNLQTFPFALYPAIPDADQSGGEALPYALAAPDDRFLPFVLSRPRQFGRRLDCARVVDADTLQVLLTLELDPILPTPDRGLTYALYTDDAADLDQFVYFGAIVPTLQLPRCRRLRLHVDEFLSAAFMALSPADLAGCLQLDWYHPGPLGGLPYGTGLRQRLYVPGAAVRYATPQEQRDVQRDAVTRQERTTFLALTRAGTFTTEPLPGYLAEALSGARAHAFFEAGTRQLTNLTLKETAFTTDRASLEITGYDTQVLIARACPEPVPVAVAPAGYVPHRYLCGDLTDTAPDWRDDGYTECEQDASPSWQDDGYTECETT